MLIEYLKYAIEIEKSGSINKAAEKLFLSRTTLQSAIDSIENEIGYKIFDRTPRGTFVTLEGKKILEDSKKIIQMVEVWYKENSSFNETYKINVAVSLLIYKLIMQYINLYFHENYSSIIIETKVEVFFKIEEIEKTLKEYRPFLLASAIDIKRIPDLINRISGYEYTPVQATPIRLYISVDNPLSSKNTIIIDDLKNIQTLCCAAILKDIISPDLFLILTNTVFLERGLVSNEKTTGLVKENKIAILSPPISKDLLSDKICVKEISDLDIKIQFFILTSQKKNLQKFEKELIDLFIYHISNETK